MRDYRKTDRGRIRDLENRVKRALGGTSSLISSSGGGVTLPIDESDVTGLVDDLYAIDTRLDLNWFDQQGLLPANTIKEELINFPTIDWEQNGGAGSQVTISRSRAKLTPQSVPLIFGWNLGATYTKGLMIAHVRVPLSNQISVMFANQAPTNTAMGGGAKGYRAEINTTQVRTVYHNGGVITEIAAETTICQAGNYQSIPTYSLALYVDGTADVVKSFVRFGRETWWPVTESSDSNIPSFTVAGFWLTGANPGWSIVPLGIYAE